MPKTLLAIDDSATMRKIFEITFAAEDFTVVTADSRANALAKLSNNPQVVLIDVSIGQDDGYALCKEIRQRDANATLILLASRFNPYDAARGKDAGADDSIDKPFDTQQALDKVRKVISAKEGGVAAAPSAPAAKPPVAPSAASTSPSMQSPFAPGNTATNAAPAPKPVPLTAPVAPPVVAPPAAAPAAVPKPNPPSFQKTRPLDPELSPPAPRAVAPAAVAAPPKSAPAAPPVAPVNSPPRPAPIAAAPSPAAAKAMGAIQDDVSRKIEELGLTAAQAEGVLSLSRDVIERVVWEVVPTLAETLIKEEIARLLNK